MSLVDDVLDYLGDNAGDIFSGAAGLAATNYAVNQGKQGLESVRGDITSGTQSLMSDIAGQAEFKPYSVTSGVQGMGQSSYDPATGALTIGDVQLTSDLQASAGRDLTNLGQGLPRGLGDYAQSSLDLSNQAMNANSGAFATSLGQDYANIGQNMLANATGAGLGGLQDTFTGLAQQAPTAPSQNLLGLQGLMSQADFSGAKQDVSGAYRGILPTNFSTSAAQQVQQQAMNDVTRAGQVQDIQGLFAGISPSAFSNLSGVVAQNALYNTDLGAQAENVRGAFAGIAPSDVRTGAGQFSQGLLSQAQQGLQQDTPTAQSIFDQIRATQMPEEERQRMALENRLAAQGRLGVQTSAFGGTPEQLALEKAQAEARNQASLQAIGMADQLASSQQARATQLGQLGLSGEQIQAQLDSEGFGQQMQLGQARLQEAQAQEALQSSVQQRQAQLAQLGLSADQIQNQLISEGFGQQMQLGQAGLQTAQLQSQLRNEAQTRANQLRQLGLSAEQVQNQLLSEGFSQDMALAGANIQAAQAQSQLESEAQNRATQLAQLGMSAEQIASQLQSEGLARSAQAAQVAAQMAQIDASVLAQQQQSAQSMLGLGLQAQELGGQLNMQDVQRAQGLFGLSNQATLTPAQLEAAQLANINSQIQASNIPYSQQMQALQQAQQTAQLAQAGQLAQLSATAQLGGAELNMLKELGLGEQALDAELVKAIGNIFSGASRGGD